MSNIKGELSLDLLKEDIALPKEFILPDDRIPPAHNQNGDDRCMAYAASGIMTVMARIYYETYVKPFINLLKGDYANIWKRAYDENFEFSEGYIYGKHRAESDSEGDGGGMFESQLMPGIVNRGACLFSSMPDIKDRSDAFDYVRAHSELDKEAVVFADMFEGYINIKAQNRDQKFEYLKKALYKYQMPVWISQSNKAHAIIACGWDKKGNIKYRQTNGFDMLFNLNYDYLKGAYVFVMSNNPPKLESFKDVNETHWAYEAINFMRNEGIMQGIGDNKFAPNKNLTRAEVAQFGYNLIKYLKENN